jgi:RNA polymerase sigma-70 factor (ECF subfamily)
MEREDDLLEALSRIARAERVALAALARREGLGPEDAFDCVHDAFCTFLQMALRGEVVHGEHAALLATIVVNNARNKRRRHHLARPHRDIEAHEPADAQLSAELLVAYAEDCVRLRGCIKRLCKTQRTVVMMRLLDERGGEDVAAALGLSRGHVDVLLHRARASLAVCMTEGEERE